MRKNFVYLFSSLCVSILSHFSHIQLFANLWTVAYQAPLSMGFSKQKLWSELPHPPLGDLPDTGMKPTPPLSPALQVDSLVLSHWESSFKFQTIQSLSHV